MNEPAILPVPLALAAACLLPRDEAAWEPVLKALLADAGAFSAPSARGDIWYCVALPDADDVAARLHVALTAVCEAAGRPGPLKHSLAACRDAGEALRELARIMTDGVASCAFLLLGGAGGRELWLVGRGPDTRRARRLAAVTPLTTEGFFCAELEEDGAVWRLGAACADWRQALLSVGKAPFSEQGDVREAALRELAQKGVWLGRGEAAPLAVMCCGQGSVWPGMGRELYDHFPAARAAMDRLAAVADWDVLALLDEKDEEKIGLTRWQQPYLFLLEYAQWSHLQSLGLCPALMCGHSLGELIALCLAGVYAPETAWYILDTRAQHMAELEARATRETGMMAVHAEARLIDEARRLWPALYVSNYNTPRQYIVSGPRDMLMEARKHFRKQRLPAIMLNVSLAFHHPGMRVLRDMSLRRLNALPMQAPRLPLLSCVTTGFYPSEQADICGYIADLDENAVRWVECVQQMWQRDGIRHFVELGPQDTLCGLVADIEPRSLCLSAARKGREAEGMRRTCAALYALGHLRAADVRAHAARLDGEATPAAAPTAAPAVRSEGAAPLGPLARRVLALLEESAGLPPGSVTPQWDLRYDLALRSSRFPLLVQQLEGVLGRSVSFEELMGVYTVGDLLAAVGLTAPTPSDDAADKASRPTRRGDALDRPPFVRYASAADGKPVPAPWDPEARGPGLLQGGVVWAWGRDGERLARLLEGIAALGQTLVVPGDCLAACERLEQLGCVVRRPQETAPAASHADAGMPPSEGPASPTGQEGDAAAFLRAALHLAEGCPLTLSGCLLDVGDGDGQAERAVAEELFSRPDQPRPGWRWLVRGIRPDAAEDFVSGAAENGASADDWRELGILEDGLPPLPREWGDMFAREICLAPERRVLWARAGALRAVLPLSAQEARLMAQPWRERPERFPGLYAPTSRERATSGRDFLLCGEFSRYARPWLAGCGGRPGAEQPELPVSQALRALLDGASLYFPWLTANGLCDVRCGAPLPLPPGVTREVRLDVRAQGWLRQDGVMTRMCRCRLEARELTDNGRHTDRWAALLDGMALLGRETAALPPLWESGAGTAPGGDVSVSAKAELAAFYDRRGVEESSRLLIDRLADGAEFVPGGDGTSPGRTLRFALGEGSGIAPEDVSGYTVFLRLIDAVEQGAWWTQEYLPAAGGGVWRLTGIGFIRFGQADGRRAEVLELRCGWRTDRLRRFDAQVCDAGGTPLVTLNQMEFERDMAAEAAVTGRIADEGGEAHGVTCEAAAQEQGARG